MAASSLLPAAHLAVRLPLILMHAAFACLVWAAIYCLLTLLLPNLIVAAALAFVFVLGAVFCGPATRAALIMVPVAIVVKV